MTQVRASLTIFELSSVISSWSESSRKSSTAFEASRNTGKASVGVAALPGTSECKLWQERSKDVGREWQGEETISRHLKKPVYVYAPERDQRPPPFTGTKKYVIQHLCFVVVLRYKINAFVYI